MYNVKMRENVKVGRFNIVFDCIEKNGVFAPFSYVKIKPGVCVIPVYKNQILLTKEFRHPFEEDMYQFTCGMIDENENPEEAAARELKEETGLIASELKYLGYNCPSVGSTTEKIYMYIAYCEDTRQAELSHEILEQMTFEWVSPEQIEKMIQNDEIVSGASVVAWYKFKAI